MVNEHERPAMRRRDGDVSLLKPWVTALTIQAQGVLASCLRGPDGAGGDDPAKALVRAFRAAVVHDARGVGPHDGFTGDGTGRCSAEEVDRFFESVDRYPHHWYVHFMHAAEIVGYMHPNREVRRFWDGFYETAVERLHLSREPVDAMVERLGEDGAIASAGELGPCPVCGRGTLVDVPLTTSLRAELGHVAGEHRAAALCSNCLTPRMAGS